MKQSTFAAKDRLPAPINIQNIFFYLIGISAIAIYSFVIYQNAYNIPKWDDFPEILLFLDRWLSAETFAQKYLAFISQTNEHILLVNHLIVLAQYYITGHLNFAWLIYIGNIFYISSALLLWILIRDHSNRAFSFAIITLTGITFYPYDSTLWAMTSISNQSVIFFSFLAIYAALKKNNNIAITMLISTLAVFSQSNGLIILLVIGVYFFTEQKWRDLKQWLIFSIVIISLYAYWFNPASRHDQSLASLLAQLPLSNFFLTVPAFIAYFGGSLFSKATVATICAAFIIGLGITAITFIQIKRNLYKKPAALLLGFLLLSISSIAVYRGLLAGPDVAFVSRYKMYGAYFLVIGVLLSPHFSLKLQKSLRWKITILSASLFYFIWSFPANLPQAKIIDKDLVGSLQRWVEDGDFRRARGFFVPDADSYLFTAIENKTYNPMVLIPDENIITRVNNLNSCPDQYSLAAPLTTDFVITHKNPNAAGIKLISHFNNNMPLAVVLCSEKKFYNFEITARQISGNESTYFIQRNAIAPDTYRVWVKYNGNHYRLESPFLNKPSTR